MLRRPYAGVFRPAKLVMKQQTKTLLVWLVLIVAVLALACEEVGVNRNRIASVGPPSFGGTS